MDDFAVEFLTLSAHSLCLEFSESFKTDCIIEDEKVDLGVRVKVPQNGESSHLTVSSASEQKAAGTSLKSCGDRRDTQ